MNTTKKGETMKYRKGFLTLLAVVCLMLAWVLSASADFGDEATLGSHDSSQRYRWRVISGGDLIPGVDGTYDIGSLLNEVDNIYVEDQAMTGNLQFQSTVFATGHNSGSTIVSSNASNLTAANLAFGFIEKEMDTQAANDQVDDLADGLVGQMVTISLKQKPLAFDYVLGGSTVNTGWSTVRFDDEGDRITFLWLDATSGWIIVSNSGCGINP